MHSHESAPGCMAEAQEYNCNVQAMEMDEISARVAPFSGKDYALPLQHQRAKTAVCVFDVARVNWTRVNCKDGRLSDTEEVNTVVLYDDCSAASKR